MKNIKKIILGLVFVAFAFSLSAQRTGELMYFSTLPQASKYNPANHGNNKLYIEIPVLGHLGMSVNTSGFAYKDFVNQHPVYPDSLQLDFNGFADKLKDNNYVGFGMSTDLLGFGFTFDKVNHVSFNLSLNFESRFNFSKGLFDLITRGTDSQDRELDVFKDKLLDATSYLTAAFGYARDIDDKLTVGGNVKLYFGLMNITSKKTDVTVEFDGATMATISNIDINTSNAFANWYMKSSSSGDGATFDDVEGVPSNIFKNKGFGLDLGATYKINDAMEVSASVIDLGWINWKSNSINVHSANPNTRVEFAGAETQYDNMGNDLDDYFNDLADSLKNSFDLVTTKNGGYSTAIPTKLYLGYSWNFFPNMYAQALYKGRIIAGTLENSLTLAYTYRMGSLQASVGNTIAAKFFNPSIMVSLGDIFYCGATFASSTNLAQTSGLTTYLGFNVVFKNKKKKNLGEKLKDATSSLSLLER